MKKTLVVIDMQNDFIDGSLGTDEAVKIVPNVRKKIEEYRSNGDEIIFTRDTRGEDCLSTPDVLPTNFEICSLLGLIYCLRLIRV